MEKPVAASCSSLLTNRGVTKKSGIIIASLFSLLLISADASAQLKGVKSVPGDYPTLAAAIADLNRQGVGPGGVILNVAAGYQETAPSGGFTITAIGSPANPIALRKSGEGVDPTFLAP